MKASLLDRLQHGPAILLDGATGTELARRGVDLTAPSWTAGVLLDNPEVLAEIHRDYALAGAEMVTANTFRTHARSLKSLGLEHQAGRLTRRAVEIARNSVPSNVWVAGSIAPLEDCYSPQLTPSLNELHAEHSQMAAHLAAAGVDFILVETQVTIREARCAAQAAQKTGLPYGVSFVADELSRLLSGETLAEAFEAVSAFSPTILLVNCLPCEDVLPALASAVGSAPGIPRGAYANTGRLNAAGTWELTTGRDPAVYAAFTAQWLSQGMKIVGGCCGTQPEHIAAIHAKTCG